MTNGACEPRRSKSSRGTNIGFRPSRCHWCRDTELCRRESSFPEFSSDNTPGRRLLNRTTVIKRILTRTLSFNAMFPSGKIQHRRVILVHIGYPKIKKRYKIRYRIPDILFPTTLVFWRPVPPDFRWAALCRVPLPEMSQQTQQVQVTTVNQQTTKEFWPKGLSLRRIGRRASGRGELPR